MTKPTIELALNDVAKTETVFDVSSLMAHLGSLPDPRKARGIRYSLKHLLTFLVLAKLAGEDSMKGMSEWVKLRGAGLVKLLNLDRETLPHQTTYDRLLENLDVEAFERVVGQFFAQEMPDKMTLAIDGKVLRGTIPPGETQGLHLLAAYVPEEGVVLMQAEADGDTLDHMELLSMVFLLLVAGHETTVNLIGNGTLALLQHPEQFALLKNDPSMIHAAIEEMLRWNGPVETPTWCSLLCWFTTRPYGRHDCD